MAAERRGSAIETFKIQQPETGGFMEKGKSFEITQEEVLTAYKCVKANHGAGGVDGVGIEQFEENRKDNLYKLWNRMASGSYFPKAVRGVEIPKKNGKTRLLGIPTIEDRVAQMVVRNRLEPLVEPVFLPDSYGYRPNKSAVDAVGAARERCWKMPWVIEFDIKGLFDHINHEKLMKAVKKHTQEKWVLLYTERFLKAPMILPNGEQAERTEGTPQGGVISPVLANLFLHYAFDRWMIQNFKGCPWERYADDGLIHCISLKQAEYVLKRVSERMQQCDLELHPEKTRIVHCHSDRHKGHHENESFDFLGYTFKTRWMKGKDGQFHEVFTPAASKEAAKKFREKIKEICLRNPTAALEQLAEILNPVIRGWYNYFGTYRKSSISEDLSYVNFTLVRWYKRNHKSAGRNLRKAWRYIAVTAKNNRELFYHWTLGKVPTI